MHGPSELAQHRYQVDSWAPTQTSGGVGRTIKSRLDGYGGMMGAGQGAVEVQGVFLDSERESYDDAALLFSASADYFVNFVEARGRGREREHGSRPFLWGGFLQIISNLTSSFRTGLAHNPRHR